MYIGGAKAPARGPSWQLRRTSFRKSTLSPMILSGEKRLALTLSRLARRVGVVAKKGQPAAAATW